jgi:hypothetical protein
VSEGRARALVARNAKGSHAAAERNAADQAITERLKAPRLEKEAAERLRKATTTRTHDD